MAFFSENRRRNMLKAGTVYLFGTGTTLKLLDMMLQGLDLPTWIMRTLAVLLFAGLPVVVYRAWRRGEDPGDSHENDPQQPQRKEPPPERSIAVLPFVNMSSDEEQEFFSDGLSEELDRACRQRLPPPAGRLSSLV